MKIFLLIVPIALFIFVAQPTAAQNPATPKPSATPVPAPSSQSAAGATATQDDVFDLSDFGVSIQPDARLIVMMAALEAAGFDATPGKDPSPFRAEVRKAVATMDPDLRRRMHDFFERGNKPFVSAAPAQQAARYVSLAYTIGPVPTLEPPERTDELPAGVLDVLDFAPLVQEFYRKSDIDERLPEYLKRYQAVADGWRRATGYMVRTLSGYLNTKPQSTIVERVAVKSPTNAKNRSKALQRYELREHERRFYVVPDLLAVPGFVNLRIIGDNYYMIVPYKSEALSDWRPPTEMRRAYAQYLIDPIILKSARAIASRRAEIRQLIDSRTANGAAAVDVFGAVSRSIAVAADVRERETTLVNVLSRLARNKIDVTPDNSARIAISRELEKQKALLSDESAAQLAEEYERGAILDFFFADQFVGMESSGFDFGSVLADMMTSFAPIKEATRLSDSAAARARALAARKNMADQNAELAADPFALRRSALISALAEIDELIRLGSFAQADGKLTALLKEFPGEPRIFFAMGRAASLSAQSVTDEVVQQERLNRAYGHYRSVVLVASSDSDGALVSRAYVAMGRILEFLDHADEAAKAYDAAIKLGDLKDGAYADALLAKNRLAKPKP